MAEENGRERNWATDASLDGVAVGQLEKEAGEQRPHEPASRRPAEAWT